GTSFGTAASGVRADAGTFAASSGWILVDSTNASRFPVRASSDGALSATEVTTLMNDALSIAHRARGQIRRPLGSSAEVTITVVDLNGEILGLVRTPDAPIFGIDVAVQKARTAMFFSSPNAAALLGSVPPAQYLSNLGSASISDYVDRTRTFLGDPAAL